MADADFEGVQGLTERIVAVPIEEYQSPNAKGSYSNSGLTHPSRELTMGEVYGILGMAKLVNPLIQIISRNSEERNADSTLSKLTIETIESQIPRSEFELRGTRVLTEVGFNPNQLKDAKEKIRGDLLNKLKACGYLLD